MGFRILFVCATSPANADAEALQIGKVLKYLSRQADCVLDLAAGNVAFPASAQGFTSWRDRTEFNNVDQLVTISCSFVRWQRILLRLVMPWVAQRPDWRFLFSWKWFQVVRKIKTKPDIIYARAFPLSSALAARKLALYYKVPLFLHFSDPWCECTQHPRWQRSRWHALQEKSCFFAASRISFASPITLKRYQARYPSLANRMYFDPNTFDPDRTNYMQWTRGDYFTVVHTGNLMLPGRYEALLGIFNSIPSGHPLFADLQFIHAGHCTGSMKKSLASLGFSSKAYCWLDPEESYRLQNQADLLLSIDNRFFEDPLDDQYLSSKMTDYIATRRPVLLMAHEGGANWQFMGEQNIGIAVRRGDFQGMASALIGYWQAWRSRDRTRFELPPPSDDYSAAAVASRIASAAREMVSRWNADSA